MSTDLYEFINDIMVLFFHRSFLNMCVICKCTNQTCFRLPSVSLGFLISAVPNLTNMNHDTHFYLRSGKMKPMNNADIIKLGCFKEMAPADPDWFYVRAASMARHLYMRTPCGVGAFTKIYGGKRI